MFYKLKKIIKKKYKPSGFDNSSRNVGNSKMKFSGVLVPISETKEEDVFIVGFPKSGNTLMQQIIAHLVYGINEDASRSMVELIAPDIYANTHYFRFNKRCFFKSHNLPQPQYKKVIYVIRDGRQALLSYYHMMRNTNAEISMKDLYSCEIKLFNSTWQEHVQSWEKNPYSAEILFVKFEDLKKNKLFELKRICQFLSLKRTQQELEDTLRLSSFNHMKSLEQRVDWSKMKERLFIKGRNFVRQGKIDSYLEEVPSDIIQIFEMKNKESLTKHYSK